MGSHLLAKARPTGREIVTITPQRAGWDYVGFSALRLATGESESLATGDRELCIVVLSGSADISAGGQVFPDLGTRDSVFDPVSPAAVYVPPGQSVTIRAQRPLEVALCFAPGGGQSHPIRLLDPGTDELQQSLVIVTGRAHALLMTEIQAAVIHSERYLGATDIKAVIHAHTPLSASCLTSACPEGHIVLIRKKNKVIGGEKWEIDQSKRNICRCRQACPRLIRVRA